MSTDKDVEYRHESFYPELRGLNRSELVLRAWQQAVEWFPLPTDRLLNQLAALELRDPVFYRHVLVAVREAFRRTEGEVPEHLAE